MKYFKCITAPTVNQEIYMGVVYVTKKTCQTVT